MSASNTNPQAEQMAHESMRRNLEAQADLIWPAERKLIAGYELGPRARVLDVGCGTGEVALRLAREWPELEVLGIDVHAPHLEYARERATEFGGRVRFELGDAFALASQDAKYDLVLCRHLLQAVPRAERLL